MHILLIYTGEFQTKKAPIGGIFQLNQAKVLKSKKYKVGILNPCVISPRHILFKYNFSDFYKINNIPIYRSYKKNFYPGKVKLSNYLLRENYKKISLDLFKKYIDKNGLPDLCHAFDIRFGLTAGDEIKKKYNIPYIFTEYCVEIANNTLPLSRKYLNKYVKRQIQEADYIALPSKAFAKKFKKFLKIKKKIHQLPPVLPADLLKVKTNKNYKFKENNFTFIVVSRIDKNKNIKVIVEAFSKLKNDSIKLKILGNGPEFDTIKKFLYDKRISIIKNSTRKQMLKQLANSNCILCSSYHETFGVGLIEAGSFGIPIISSKCEGPSEIINKTNGLIVKKNTADGFYFAMKKMLNNYKKYNSDRIKKDIRKRYGHETYIYKYKKITNKILK